MNARTFKQMATVLLTLAAILLFTLPAFADVVPPTTQQIKDMVSRAQTYLKSLRTPDSGWTREYSAGYGYYDNSYPVAATGLAVAALLDTGIPNTDPDIVAGINYLRANLIANCSEPGNPLKYGDRGISEAHGAGSTYQTGIALIALATNNDRADETTIKNMITLFENSQSAAGGWRYNLSGQPADHDLSVTQFGVMGLWYGYRYLGKTFDANTTVKNKVFSYLQSSYTGGQFTYEPGYYITSSMTAAGLWSLGMIGMDQDTLASPSGKSMRDGVINWFNNNYSWPADSYYVFGMAKALTIALGEQNKVGDPVNGRAWVEDLKSAMYAQRVDVTPADPTTTYWYNSYGSVIDTSMVLLSLSFADVNQPVPSRILAQDTGIDNDIKGSVVIHTKDGVLIEPVRDPNDANKTLPFRTSTTGEGLSKETTTYLPLGAFRFKLKPVGVAPNCGGTAEFTVNLPAGALDPNNKKSFIDKNGNLKKGLDWFKLDNGKWKGNKKIPLVLDKTAGTITVTLTDGGLGDDDKTVNCEITDPAAPGYDPFVDLTLADALKTLKIAVGIDPVTADALLSYDIAPVVNGEVLPDGKVDLFDAMMILRKSVGLPVTPTGGV